MMIPIALAAVFLAASCQPAAADLIFTPIFTVLLATVGIEATAIAFGSTTWVALLSGIATIALGIGLALLMTPKPPRPDDGHTAIQQSIPPVVYGYGRARVAGGVVLKEARDNILHMITAIAGHEIIGIVTYYLHDDAVEVVDGQVAAVADGRYAGEGWLSYGSNVHLESRLGAAVETPYAHAVLSLPEIWTNEHRGDGVASVYMRAISPSAGDFGRIFPYGPPQPSVVADLARVFDPRDPAQAWDDPTTWTSAGYDNPALALLHYECFSPFGALRPYEVAVLPILDLWIEEANICDEPVPLKAGGTERRYRLSGWTDTERTDVRGTRAQILQTCDGWFVERGDGTIRLIVGKYRAPTVEITDDDIVDWSWQSSLADSERYERMLAKYNSPDNGYSTVDTDSVPLDNGARAAPKARTAPLDLPWVAWTGQASRLLRREVSRYHEPVRGRLGLRLSGLNALYERWVYVNSSVPRLRGVVIENRGPRLSITEGRCAVDFISSGPHVDVYDPMTDESRPPALVTRPDNAVQPVPVIHSAVAEASLVSGVQVVYIAVVIAAPTYDTGIVRTDLNFALRWRVASKTVWSKLVITDYDVVSDEVALETGHLIPGTTYVVEVASIASNGTYSAWCEPVEVSTSVSTLAPAAPSDLSGIGGLHAATLSWTAPNVSIVAACRIWRAATGSSFGSATDVSGPIFCSANQALTFVDHPLAGGWTYWATAETAGAISSTPSPSVTVTVT